MLILHSFETLRGGLSYYIFFCGGLKIYYFGLFKVGGEGLGIFSKNFHYSEGTIQLFIGIHYFKVIIQDDALFLFEFVGPGFLGSLS